MLEAWSSIRAANVLCKAYEEDKYKYKFKLMNAPGSSAANPAPERMKFNPPIQLSHTN